MTGRGNPSTVRSSPVCSDRSYQVILQTEVGDLMVSTVWLGIDHESGKTVRPVIFETLVFDQDGEELDGGRYEYEEKALTGHQRFVQKYTSPKED